MNTKTFLLAVLTVFFTCSIAFTQVEEITLSTYYPAPYGDYDELAAEKLFVDKQIIGNMDVDGDGKYSTSADINAMNVGSLLIEGNVGIGTTSPQSITSNADLTIAGTIAQDGWTAPTLLSGWANYGFGYNPAGYFRDKNGIVHLRGLLSSTGATASTIFTLPAGYRPAYRELQMGQCYSGGYYEWRVDIDTSGNVIAARGAPSNWLSLDGITFRASGY